LVELSLTRIQHQLDWIFAYECYRAGLVARPEQTAFSVSMPHFLSVLSLGNYVQKGDDITYFDRILADDRLLLPEVLTAFDHAEMDEMWGLEPNLDGYRWQSSRHASEDFSWRCTLLRLVAENHLDANELCQAALRALARSKVSLSANWYLELLEALVESVEKTEAGWESRFIDGPKGSLIGVVLGPRHASSDWAIKRLAALEKAGRLDAEPDVLSALSQFVPSAKKASGKRALRLAGQIGKRKGRYSPQVIQCLLEALLNEHTEVQGAAVKLLKEHQKELTEAHTLHLVELSDVVPPSLRTSLSELTGVDQALLTNKEESVVQSGLPTPRALDVERALEPVSHDEKQLIEAFSHLVQNDVDIYRLELVLAAMCATGTPKGQDRFERGRPLVKLMNGSGSFSWHANYAVSSSVSPLVRAWLGGGYCLELDTTVPAGSDLVDDCFLHKNHGSRGTYGQRMLLHYQIGMYAYWLSQKVPHQPLNTPTHERGWIDPRILVERAQRSESEGHPIPVFEISSALLRLALEGRKAALPAAMNLTTEYGRALRFALGDDSVEVAQVLQNAALRSRQPTGHLPEDRAGHLTGPDGRLSAEATITIRPGYEKTRGRYVEKVEAGLGLTLSPELDKHARPSLPGQLYGPLMKAHTNWMFDTLGIIWQATFWPANSFPTACICVQELSHPEFRGSDAEYVQTAEVAVLRCLLDRSFGFEGYVALWLGLSAKGANTRSLATDLLINQVEYAWFDSESCAQALLFLLPDGVVRINRILPCIKETVQVSPRHRQQLLQTLQVAIALPPGTPPPRLFRSLLDFLIEQRLLPSPPSLPDGSREYLESIEAKRKLAQSIKKLLP